MEELEFDSIIAQKRSFRILSKAEDAYLSNINPSRRCKVENICSKNCCWKFCSKMFSIYELCQFRAEIQEIFVRSPTKQFLFFIHQVVRMVAVVSVDNSISLEFGNVTVCSNFLSQLLGVSVNRLLFFATHLPLLQKSQFKSSRLRSEATTKKISAVLENLKKLSQHHPMGGRLMNCGILKRTLFTDGPTKFNATNLRQIAGPIKFRKRDSLIRCETCASLRSVIQRETGNEKEEAAKLLNHHINEISNERTSIDVLENISKSDESLLVVKIDSMSNSRTKLPCSSRRPKSISDSIRVSLNITCIQSTRVSEGYENSIVSSLSELYGNDSSYYASMILAWISKRKSIPTTLVLNMDNYCPNKSNALLGFFGVVLVKLKHLKTVIFAYSRVGHTHNQVDALFGTISRKLAESEVWSPAEMAMTIQSMPCVENVESDIIVYDIANLASFVSNIKNRQSHHQYKLFLDCHGKVMISIGKYIDSLAFETTGTNDIATPLFKNNFNIHLWKPIRKEPNVEKTMMSVDQLLKASGNLLSRLQINAFREAVNAHGTTEFDTVIEKINSIPASSVARKFLPPSTDTIVTFLKKHGRNVGRVPGKLQV